MRKNVASASHLPTLFYKFLSSKALTQISMMSFIIFFMWEIVVRYHSVFLAGMIVTIYVGVELLVSFPIGHMIDRRNNTRLNFASSFFIFMGFIILLAGESLVLVYIAAVLLVFATTLKIDSFSAIIKKHVPEASFKKANSLTFATNSASSLVGTLLGGLAIIYIQAQFVYLLLAMAAASILLSIPVEEKIIARGGERVVAKEVKEVGSFLRSIATFLLLAFFLNGLFISLDTYSSGLFNLVLKSSPIYYTAFSISVPLGMMLGIPIANVKYFKKERPVTIALMTLLFSPLIFALAFSRSPLADVIDAFAIGLILPIINIPLNTKLMQVVPHGIYGKVMALVKIFATGASPVMAAVFSTMALFFSIPFVLFWVAVLVIPLTIYSIRIVPRFFRLSSGGPEYR
jgi:DHA3 family macrolide efflux protein-like MFS transporter